MSRRLVLAGLTAAGVFCFSVVTFNQAVRVPGAQVRFRLSQREARTGAAPGSVGIWEPARNPGDAIQATGAKNMPDTGRPEHQLPFTPEGLKANLANKPAWGPGWCRRRCRTTRSRRASRRGGRASSCTTTRTAQILRRRSRCSSSTSSTASGGTSGPTAAPIPRWTTPRAAVLGLYRGPLAGRLHVRRRIGWHGRADLARQRRPPAQLGGARRGTLRPQGRRTYRGDDHDRRSDLLLQAVGGARSSAAAAAAGHVRHPGNGMLAERIRAVHQRSSLSPPPGSRPPIPVSVFRGPHAESRVGIDARAADRRGGVSRGHLRPELSEDRIGGRVGCAGVEYPPITARTGSRPRGAT